MLRMPFRNPLSTNYLFRALALFDMDGTLIPSGINNGGHARAVFMALEKLCGIRDATLEGIDYHGLTDTQLIYALLAKSRKEKTVTPEMLYAIFTEMTNFYVNENANIDIHPLPGVRDLFISLLQKGVMIGIVTGAIGGIARFKLRKAGLFRFARISEFGDQALRRSDLIISALRKNEQNKWTSREKVYLFGDTPRDIEAGKVVGLKTIGVATGLVSKESLAIVTPDYLFDNLMDTALLLKIILG